MSEQKPKFELTALELDEGSLVDKGDNPPAKVVLWKGEGGPGVMEKLKAMWAKLTKADMPAQPMTTAEILSMQEFEDSFCALKGALVQSIYGIMNLAPAEKMGEMMRITVEEFAAQAAELVKNASLGKRGDDVLHAVAAVKAAMERGDGTLVQQVQKLDQFTTVPGSNTEGDGKPVETHKQGENMETKPITLEDAIKGIADPAHKAVIEAALKAQEETKKAADADKATMEKRMVASEKTATDALAMVEKMAAERAEQELVAKAAKFQVPGQTQAEILETLKAAHAVNRDSGERMEKAFAALTAQTKLNSRLNASIGKAGVHSGADASAHSQLVAKASELQRADPKLTNAQAYVRAGELNPALKAAAINGDQG